MIKNERLLIPVYRLLLLIALIVLWYIASLHVQRNLIPSPWATLLAGQRLIADGRLFKAVGESLSIYVSGYAIAAGVAIFLGVLMGALRPLGKTLEVYVYALAAMPRVAFIPLIIIFLGVGFQAKLFVVFLGAVMPILVNTYAGVLAVDDDLVEMARSMGVSRWRTFTQIVLPSAVPFVIVGLRVGATIGLINTIVAELYTAVTGLGGLIAIYGSSFRMAEYFVVIIVLAIIGVIVTEVLRHVELRLGRWKRSA